MSNDHMALVTVAQFAKRLGVTDKTVLARYREHTVRNGEGKLAFFASFVDDALTSIEDDLDYDRDYVVPLTDIAERTGRSAKQLSRSHRSVARVVRGKLHVTPEIAQNIYDEFGVDHAGFTVTRDEAARRMNCHRDTVTQRMKGCDSRLVGRKRHYRESDVLQKVAEEANAEWLTHEGIQILLNDVNVYQFWYIWHARRSTQFIATNGVWHDALPSSDEMPSCQSANHKGPLWRRGTIQPWCEVFVEMPETFLVPSSLERYELYANKALVPLSLVKKVRDYRLAYMQNDNTAATIRKIDTAAQRDALRERRLQDQKVPHSHIRATLAANRKKS